MLLHSYMDALNVRERAASGDAPAGGGDLEKQFKSAKARMYPTNNGDKPPSKGITGRLPGNGDKSQPDAVKGIAPAHPMAAEPTISIPQIWMVPPDIKTKLADPNVEPKFNVPDVSASMGT